MSIFSRDEYPDKESPGVVHPCDLSGRKQVGGTKEIILQCSNCDADLVNICITEPEVEVVTNVVAICAFCKDHSFIQEVVGRFRFAPADGVGINDIETEGTLTTIITIEN